VLEIKVEKFEAFTYFVGILKAISEEHQLYINESGIRANTMDPSHVMMVDTELPAKISGLEAGEEKHISINVLELKKFLDRISNDEDVVMHVVDEKARYLIVAKKGGHSRRFDIPLLEPEYVEVPKPKIFFKAQARLAYKSLDNAVKDAALVAEHVTVKVEEGKLIFSGKGDMGDAYNEWEKGSDDLLDLKLEEESHATYTLELIKSIVAAINKADAVLLEVSTDMPMKIETVGGPAKATFYAAPCIGV
jgi:proliferating cell nuclear antigen